MAQLETMTPLKRDDGQPRQATTSVAITYRDSAGKTVSQTCLMLLEEPLCHLSLMPIPEGGVSERVLRG